MQYCHYWIITDKERGEGDMAVTQIKIFEGNGNNEKDINAWLKDNPDIKVLSVILSPLYDLYNCVPPNVCNQWIATTITYTINDAEQDNKQDNKSNTNKFTCEDGRTEAQVLKDCIKYASYMVDVTNNAQNRMILDALVEKQIDMEKK